MKLLLPVLIVFCLVIGCKGKDKYRTHKDGYDPECSICKGMSDSERLTWIHDNKIWKRDSTPTKWTDATKATIDTMVITPIDTSIVWDISGSGTISHHLVKEPIPGTWSWGSGGGTTNTKLGELDQFPIQLKPKKKSNDVGMSTKPSGKIQFHGGSDNQTGTATYALSVDKDRNIIDTIPPELFFYDSDTTRGYMDLIDITESYFEISDSIGHAAIRNNKTREWEIQDCKRALEVVYMLDSIRQSERKLKNKQ